VFDGPEPECTDEQPLSAEIILTVLAVVAGLLAALLMSKLRDRFGRVIVLTVSDHVTKVDPGAYGRAELIPNLCVCSPGANEPRILAVGVSLEAWVAAPRHPGAVELKLSEQVTVRPEEAWEALLLYCARRGRALARTPAWAVDDVRIHVDVSEPAVRQQILRAIEQRKRSILPRVTIEHQR
jgi:hypothetical protein